MATFGTFDFDAFIAAVDGQRRQEGLPWRELAGVLWAQSAELNAERDDSPL